MSGEAWLYLLAVLLNAVNLFLQVFFTIMYSDLEWYVFSSVFLCHISKPQEAAFVFEAACLWPPYPTIIPNRNRSELTVPDPATTSIPSISATVLTPILSPKPQSTRSSPSCSSSTATGLQFCSTYPCSPGMQRRSLRISIC